MSHNNVNVKAWQGAILTFVLLGLVAAGWLVYQTVERCVLSSVCLDVCNQRFPGTTETDIEIRGNYALCRCRHKDVFLGNTYTNSPKPDDVSNIKCISSECAPRR